MPAAQPPGQAASNVLMVLAALVGLFALWYAIQSNEPQVLFFGMFFVTLLAVVAFLVGWLPKIVGLGQIRVRCGSCQALSPEGNKFCGQCGKAI